MVRPRKRRRVRGMPAHTFYKPQGVPVSELQSSILSVEGFEALRLTDANGMDQAEAADRMDVSRPTFSRILSEARRTVAQALTNGWAIIIQGGDYEFDDGVEAGPVLPRGRGMGRGRGQRGQGMGKGPNGGRKGPPR